MKVLLVHDYGAPYGGADHLTIGLRDELRRQGHEARLLASSARPLPLANLADETCFGTQSPARQLLQIANPSAARRLRDVLARFQPDVVQVVVYWIQLSPLILPALARVPTVLYPVNYDHVCPINTKRLPDGRDCHHLAGRVCVREGCASPVTLARYAVQRRLSDRWRGAIDAVVAPSDWVARRLRGEGLRVDETIWIGVPHQPARPPLGGPPTVGFAGRLVTKKGVDVLLAAMARVAARLPEARLLVAGEGPDRAALEARGRALGLGERVSWLGHLERDAMERALGAAWVQTVPSLWEEPFGMVASEAMMRGTAVVASGTGGLAEFVLPGQTGVTVPPGDPDALARALLGVLADREGAERLGASARAFALAELGEGRYAERFAALYERLVAGRAPAGAPVRAGRERPAA